MYEDPLKRAEFSKVILLSDQTLVTPMPIVHGS